MEFQIDWSIFQSIVISLALGGIVGLERQTHAGEKYGTEFDEFEPSGIRTFALSSLLGTLVTLSSDIATALPYVLGFAYLALLLTHRFAQLRHTEKPQGITTEVAALIVFALGAMVPGHPILAAGIAVIVALILSVKRYVHDAVEKLSRKELYGTLKLLLISVVLLPLLPDQFVDPWGIYNPRWVWLLVVVISAISFCGYFAMRVLGTSRGLSITGALGGLASSTAVILAMSDRVGEAPESRRVTRAAVFAVVMANTIMFGRVAVEVAITNLALLNEVLVPLGAMAAAGLISAAICWRWLSRARKKPADEDEDENPLELENPFRLIPALKFALIFVVILAVIHVANRQFGDQGSYLAALIAGLANTDATSLAAARMHVSGELSTDPAVATIVLAAVSNTVVKAGLGAFLGSLRFGGFVLLALGPTIVTGAAFALWLIF